MTQVDMGEIMSPNELGLDLTNLRSMDDHMIVQKIYLKILTIEMLCLNFNCHLNDPSFSFFQILFLKKIHNQNLVAIWTKVNIDGTRACTRTRTRSTPLVVL
jgi:hypothetical protein